MKSKVSICKCYLSGGRNLEVGGYVVRLFLKGVGFTIEYLNMMKLL